MEAVFLLATILITLYVNGRLFLYIKKLEDKVQKSTNLSENLMQSLKDLVHEDFLLNDGRLKKLTYQKEKKKIYNGVLLQEEETEF